MRRRIGVLDRFNIPALVVGGFLFATVALVLRQSGVLAFEFNTTLQAPFMIAFFTTIGLGREPRAPEGRRSRRSCCSGSWRALLAAVQNGVGVLLANGAGRASVPRPHRRLHHDDRRPRHRRRLRQAAWRISTRLTGAVTLAMAAATFGLVSGGLIGGPDRHARSSRTGSRLRAARRRRGAPPPTVEAMGLDERDRHRAGRRGAHRLHAAQDHDRHPGRDVGRLAAEPLARASASRCPRTSGR
ncbi:MAG: sodium/glutamate symporter [Marinilabiliales bacterium]|nr:sodium/glutamate symporter [Marinilabiliales bacterium]